MSNGLSGFEAGGRRPYKAKVQAKASASTSCSFCWFVLQVNPTLKEMSQRDTLTFREHLRRAHGLQEEIQR